MSLLPGMFPAGVAAARAGAPVLTILTKVAEAVSTGTTVTGPAGIQAGDLLVLWDRAFSVGLPSEAVPADFEILATANNGSTNRCILSYKIATGAEASASLTGMAGSILVDKVLIVLRGDLPITSVTPAGGTAVVQNTNPTAQVVPSSAGAPPLVVLGGYASGNGTVNPRTFTPTKDGEATSGADCFLAWLIYNSAPADVTVDMDDEGDNNALASGYLACA